MYKALEVCGELVVQNYISLTSIIMYLQFYNTIKESNKSKPSENYIFCTCRTDFSITSDFFRS